MKKILCLLFMFFSFAAFAAVDCNSPTAFPSTKEECAQCPNRNFGVDVVSKHMIYRERNVCYLKECPDGYFFDSRHKNCLPCDYAEQKCLNISPEECAKCPNRQMSKYVFTTQCELPFSCPPDKPAMHVWAGFEDSCRKDCYPCEKAGKGFWADDCSVCPGYEVDDSAEFDFGKVFCSLKDTKSTEDEEDIEYYEPEIAPLP